MKLRTWLLGLLAAPALLAAAPKIPAYTDYVVDTAHVFDAGAVDQIVQVARRLDKAGIAQIAVLTVPDLGDSSPEEYAVAVFKQWGLGHVHTAQQKKDDGVLVLMVPGKPGQRRTKIETGYDIEGILPDGKLGAIYDRVARPYILQNDYGTAAVRLVDAIAQVLEADAAAGGTSAPTARTPRGGRGAASARGPSAPVGAGGLGVAILCMAALLIALMRSGMRRQFPGKKTGLLAALLTVAAAVGLIALGGGAGWIALLVGLVANGFAYASIRSHKCPRDGSWMTIDQRVVDEPTYFSRGLAHVIEQCTNPKCGYRREYDKELPRKQRTVYVSGGRGGWGGGGGGDGFSGGGGGTSGGGGISRSD